MNLSDALSELPSPYDSTNGQNVENGGNGKGGDVESPSMSSASRKSSLSRATSSATVPRNFSSQMVTMEDIFRTRLSGANWQGSQASQASQASISVSTATGSTGSESSFSHGHHGGSHEEGFTLAYKSHQMPDSFGRSSSRYFDMMLSQQPWVHSSAQSNLNPTMGSNSRRKDSRTAKAFMHVPQVVPIQTSQSASQLGFDPISPELTPLEVPSSLNLDAVAVKGEEEKKEAAIDKDDPKSTAVAAAGSESSAVVMSPNGTKFPGFVKQRSTSFPSSDKSGIGPQDRRPSLKSLRSNRAGSHCHLPSLSIPSKTSSSEEDDERTQKTWQNAAPPLALYVHAPHIFGEVPPDLVGHTCTLVRDKLYIFGGRTGSGEFSNTLYIYNCTTALLTKPKLSGDIPPPMSDMTATRGGSYIHFIGGQNSDRQVINDMYMLNVNTFRFQKVRPTGNRPMPPRKNHTTILSGVTLYVFGGFGVDDGPLNDVWKVSMIRGAANSSFQEVISLEKDTDLWPTPRGNHSAHFVPAGSIWDDVQSDCMLIYGGNDRKTVFDEAWVFGLESERWWKLKDTCIKRAPNASPNRPPAVQLSGQSSPLDHTPESPFLYPTGTDMVVGSEVSRPRTMHVSQLSGKYLMVYGGHDGRNFIDTMDILNLKSRRWTLRHCNGIRALSPCQHTGVIHDSRFFLYGGFDANSAVRGMRVMEMPLLPLVG